MMQGDSYYIYFNLKTRNKGEEIPIDPSCVSEIELRIGSIRKTYTENEIIHVEGCRWKARLLQTETFSLAMYNNAQVRVKLTSGDVIGTSASPVQAYNSLSKEVI